MDMETKVSPHRGYESWLKYKGQFEFFGDRPPNGMKHYNFRWDNHSASMIQCQNSSNGDLVWEIWVGEDEDPVQCGSRNKCLDYMYRKWLSING